MILYIERERSKKSPKKKSLLTLLFIFFFQGLGTGMQLQQQQQQQQQQMQQQPNQNEAVFNSMFNCNIYGDERDVIIGRWNMIQALWGVGKGIENLVNLFN